VFRVDVGGTCGPGDLVGVEQGSLRGRRDRGVLDARRRRLREPLFGGAGDGLGVDAETRDGVLRGLLAHDDAQDVERVELVLTAFECEPAGALQDLLRPRGEEAAEVDGARRTRPLALEVSGEEVVERRRSAVCCCTALGEVFGHVNLLDSNLSVVRSSPTRNPPGYSRARSASQRTPSNGAKAARYRPFTVEH
jgi:hypothetical protein